jgi:hypothetical protein
VSRVASTLLVLGVLGSTAAAFAVTERLKLQKIPIEATQVVAIFSPVCDCDQNRAAITFRVRRPQTVTLRVLNGDGDTVRLLARRRHVGNGLITFRWNGRDEEGRLVPDGTYAVRLDLGRDERRIRLPREITVDTVAPTASFVSVAPRTIRRVPGARVVVRYRLSQPAHAALFVNRRRVAVTQSRRRVSELKWFARRNGAFLPRGRYSLRLAGLDDAGNLGPLTRPVVVRIR